MQEEKILQPLEGRSSPVESPIQLQGKNSLWPRVNHKKQV
jgi:hypothetical protein